MRCAWKGNWVAASIPDDMVLVIEQRWSARYAFLVCLCCLRSPAVPEENSRSPNPDALIFVSSISGAL
jgi:hypothetical protein